MSFQALIDALTESFNNIINYIPRLINGLLVLLVGYLVAWLVSRIVGWLLARARIDRGAERVGLSQVLASLGVRVPLSRVIPQIVFVFMLISFLVTSTRLLGLEPVARLLDELILFFPNLLAAVIVFLLGYMFARFLGDLVGSAATNAGLIYGPRLGRIARYGITIFATVLALAALGVNTDLLISIVTILVAAFGLALGLALGLGARSYVHHILAGYYMRQRLPIGQPVEFGEVRGEIGGIGSVNTLVGTTTGSVLIPNGTLVESIVTAPRPEPTPEAQPPAQ
jgi:small-conductance mechanosensitive channel